MRIALVSAWYWPALGGTESAIATLASTLTSRGHDVVIHTRSFNRAIGEELDPFGIRVRRHRELFAGAFNPVGANDADVVHVHGTDRGLIAIGANVLRRPLITLHNGLGRLKHEYIGQQRVEAKTVFDRWFARGYLNKYSRVVCLHEEERTRMLALCGSEQRLSVIPNSVPEGLFDYSRDHARNVSDYFVALGRLAPDKGMDLLVRAAAAGGFRLIIAGEGAPEYRRSLEQLVKETRADVVFAGYLEGDKKYRLVANARAMLVGSPYEGLSIAILEAMALGVPVVAAPEASRELIEHRVTGWHYEWPSIESLLTAVSEIQSSTPFVERIVSRAQGVACDRFHPSAVAAQLEELYATVI